MSKPVLGMLAAALFTAVCLGAGHAAPLATWQATGISSTAIWPGVLYTGPVTITYTFDFAASDQFPAQTNFGVYPIISGSVALGSDVITWTGGTHSIQTESTFLTYALSIFGSSGATFSGTFGGQPIVGVQFSFYQIPNALNSDALFDDPSLIYPVISSQLSVFRDFQGAVIAVADNVQLTATPVPAALPLFATGLGALGFIAYRRKRKTV